MKYLSLIRHGAAADPINFLKDFDRPLTPQGRAQAANIGQQLQQQGGIFEQLYCSSAIRALSTAQIIHDKLQSKGHPLVADSSLYNADIHSLYHFIEMIDEPIEHAALVAHNPGLSYLANDLLRDSVPAMSTCTVIQLSLNIKKWVDINTHCAQLLNINRPKVSLFYPPLQR